MQAIILAAGRGSRMGEKTAHLPKCLLPLAGQTLLFWQARALRAAGIQDISIVRGYQAHLLEPAALGLPSSAFHCLENPRWAETNMVRTLLCADDILTARGGLVAYADIVYHPDHLKALMASPWDIAITYDTFWESLWTLRFGDPLLDAETFAVNEGLLREIGGKPQSLQDIAGQYMGLLLFSARGWECIKKYCQAHEDQVDGWDMTTLLRRLLAHNVPIGAVPVAGKWCEGDTPFDLAQYEHMLAQGGWSHDWRAEEDIR